MLLAIRSCSSHWDIRYYCLGFARKAFLSTIYIVNNVHLWNGTNFDTCNNLHSFCYGHNNHVLYIGIQDIDWIWKKRFSFDHFPCSQFSSEKWDKLVLMISILFVIGTTTVFSILWYMIMTLWTCKKSFSFHHFPYNQSLSMKWGKLGYP